MKLKINSALDLNSISVLPPHSRRPNGKGTGTDSSIYNRTSQLRSQQSQTGISSQSQFSQGGISSISQNELSQRFGSQERENSSANRISRLGPNSSYEPRWGPAAPPPVTNRHRCQVSEEMEHRTSQLRSQQSQIGISSQTQLSQGGISSISQNSMDSIIKNQQKFGSQERENSAKRIPCLAPNSSYPREETQMSSLRSPNNDKPRWGSAPRPITDRHKCQVSEQLEHRTGQIETKQNRQGMILESVQGDVIQVKKQMQEFALDIGGIKQKLAGHDNSLQLVLKGEENIKATLQESFKSFPDQLRKEVHQEFVSAISALQNQNEERLLKLTTELSGLFTKSVKAITSSLQPSENCESVPSMLKLKARDCPIIQSQNMEPAVTGSLQPFDNKKSVPSMLKLKAKDCHASQSQNMEPAVTSSLQPFDKKRSVPKPKMLKLKARDCHAIQSQNMEPAVTSSLQPFDNKKSVPTMLKLKERDCHVIQSENMEPATDSAAVPLLVYTRRKRKPEKKAETQQSSKKQPDSFASTRSKPQPERKAETRQSSKQKLDSFANAHRSKMIIPKEIPLIDLDGEWRKNYELDEELDGGFAYLLREKETGLLEGDNKGENIAKVSVTDRIDSQTVVENVDEGIRVTIDSSSVATITGSMVEQVQVVEGGEVAMMDCGELFETREVAPRTNAFAGNPSSLEDTQSVEAQAVGGVESERDMALVDGDLASDVHMTEHNGSVEGRDTGVDIVDGDKNVEAQTACGSSKSTANGNLCYEDETSEQGGKHDTVALVGEPVSHQVDGVEKMDSCLVNEKLDDGVHATVDPSSLPDGFQHTGLRIDSERIMENHVLGDGMLPDVSHENGAEINEMEGDTDFSVLVLDEELISDSVDVDNFEGNGIEIGDNFAGFEQRNSMEQEVVNTETLPEPNTPPGKEGEFSVHNPEDHAHPNNRNEKSLSDLMTTKKPDIDDHNHVDVNSTAPQSFKIGERILRIACQLTNGPSILKSGSKNPQGKGVKFLKKHSCQDLLSKLLLAARDHKKGHGVLPVIVGFFSEFRNSSSQNYPGLEQRKKSEHMVVSAQPFDFEGTKDSYWTDRIVQNTSDEQAAGKNSKGKEETDLLPNPTQKDNVSQAPGNPPRLLVTEVLLGDGNKELTLSTLKNRKRKENSDKENPPGSTDPGPPTKKSSSNRSRKKKEPPLVPDNNNNTQLNDVQEKKDPTALLLKFTEPFPIPSVTNLNRMFRRFGPLKESETQVAKDTNQAIIVFKTHSDAEVALSSAGKFSIFGPVVVSYELSCFQLPPPEILHTILNAAAG